MRGWQLALLVAAVLVGLALAGRLTAPPPTTLPAASPPLATGGRRAPDHIHTPPSRAPRPARPRAALSARPTPPAPRWGQRPPPGSTRRSAGCCWTRPPPDP